MIRILNNSFYQVDVFSSELFGGNPLAVFLRGENFKEIHLQQIAREMNLSETTFIFPPSHPDADFDVRIFTPEKEIPFAGHPILGTAFVLRHANRIPPTQNQIRLNFKSGLIPVDLEADGKFFMTQPSGKILETILDTECVAEALGLNRNNIDPGLPIQIASTGFPALLVPINSLRSIQRIILNLSLLKALLEETNVDMIYPFTRQTFEKKNSIHARGFAPFIGINEDPATGSVAGALGYCLYKNNSDEREWVIEQGYEINRPGNIFVEIDESTAIRVGGNARLVFKGDLY